MNSTTTLTGILKSLASSDNDGYSSLYALTINNTGALKKRTLSTLRLTNLNKKEIAGSVMSLKEFTLKYVEPLKSGCLLSDLDSNYSTSWEILLPNGTQINTQKYLILIAKYVGSLTSNWCYINLLFFPAGKTSQDIYFVCQENGGSQDAYHCSVHKVPFETVYTS